MAAFVKYGGWPRKFKLTWFGHGTRCVGLNVCILETYTVGQKSGQNLVISHVTKSNVQTLSIAICFYLPCSWQTLAGPSGCLSNYRDNLGGSWAWHGLLPHDKIQRKDGVEEGPRPPKVTIFGQAGKLFFTPGNLDFNI